MKFIGLFFYCLSGILVIASCNNHCEPFDQMPEFDELQNIPGVEEKDLDCIDYVNLPRTFIIQTDSVYQNMLGPLMSSGVSSCQPDTLPTIDFTTRTLLWAYTFDIDVEKAVVKNGNTITFLLKIKTSQFAIAHFRMNAVTIPRISETDTIIFEGVLFGCD